MIEKSPTVKYYFSMKFWKILIAIVGDVIDYLKSKWQTWAIIQGWANYHRYVVSKRIFSRQDYILWNQLYSWGKRRHPEKSKFWLKNRYWHRDGKRDWIFETKNSRLTYLAYIPIVRYRRVILEKNPYLDQKYFKQRIFWL